MVATVPGGPNTSDDVLGVERNNLVLTAAGRRRDVLEAKMPCSRYTVAATATTTAATRNIHRRRGRRPIDVLLTRPHVLDVVIGLDRGR